MKHEINIENWKRKEHYEYFSRFDEPLFGITSKVECSKAYHFAKQKAYPFSLYYLYLSLQTIHEIEEFRYRMENGKIYCYDTVGAGPTIMREDNTYGCGYYAYSEDIEDFMRCAQAENKRVMNEKGLNFPHEGQDIIHYSTLPWIDFSSVNHARKFSKDDSIPKITFGKIIKKGEKMWLTVDLHANHALMDGWHASRFFSRLQELLNEQ